MRSQEGKTGLVPPGGAVVVAKEAIEAKMRSLNPDNWWAKREWNVYRGEDDPTTMYAEFSKIASAKAMLAYLDEVGGYEELSVIVCFEVPEK